MRSSLVQIFAVTKKLARGEEGEVQQLTIYMNLNVYGSLQSFNKLPCKNISSTNNE
jgi:hypothetical protein